MALITLAGVCLGPDEMEWTIFSQPRKANEIHGDSNQRFRIQTFQLCVCVCIYNNIQINILNIYLIEYMVLIGFLWVPFNC